MHTEEIQEKRANFSETLNNERSKLLSQGANPAQVKKEMELCQEGFNSAMVSIRLASELKKYFSF